jgi:RimJ/RimL family protein N-acetyltransferase
VEELAAKMNDKDISRNMASIPYPFPVERARDIINKTLKEKRKKEPTFLHFVIEVNGEIAGAIFLPGIVQGHKAQLGYWLARKFRGRKLMTAAIKEVCRFGFQELKLKRISSRVFPFNEASRRVLEKNGFEFEGELRKDVKKNGRYYDSQMYAKILNRY